MREYDVLETLVTNLIPILPAWKKLLPEKSQLDKPGTKNSF